MYCKKMYESFVNFVCIVSVCTMRIVSICSVKIVSTVSILVYVLSVL